MRGITAFVSYVLLGTASAAVVMAARLAAVLMALRYGLNMSPAMAWKATIVVIVVNMVTGAASGRLIDYLESLKESDYESSGDADESEGSSESEE